MDMWQSGPPSREQLTTVGNWLQTGREIDFGGERYKWSKHHEFEKFIDIPLHLSRPLELATNVGDADNEWDGGCATVPAFAVPDDARSMLRRDGWNVTSGSVFSTDLWAYRNYILESSGEFIVARDLNVRLRSGWFSERGARAIWRPPARSSFSTPGSEPFSLWAKSVLVQYSRRDPGAFDAIATDYRRHNEPARAIANDYFDANVVLPRLLDDLGM